MQVQQQVDDDLAGSVVGDLTAAVDLDDGNTDVIEDVLGLAGLAERIDRRVFDDPQFVGRFRRADGSKVLHGPKGRRVVDPPQAFDD